MPGRGRQKAGATQKLPARDDPLYSLVCTRKILDLETWKYLTKVFIVLAESPATSPDSLAPLSLKPHLG